MQKYAEGTTLVSLNSLFPKKIIEASFDFPRIASQSPKQLQQSVSLPLDQHLSHELAKRGTGLIEWFKICHIDCSNLSNDYLLLLKEVVPGHHEEWFLMLPSGLPRRLTGPPVLWITPPAKQRMNRMAQLAEPMASWPWVAKNSFVGLKGDHASQRRRKRTFYIHEREKGNKKIGDGRYNKAIPTCYNLWNVMSALIQFWPSSTKQSTFRKIAPSNQTSHNKKSSPNMIWQSHHQQSATLWKLLTGFSFCKKNCAVSGSKYGRHVCMCVVRVANTSMLHQSMENTYINVLVSSLEPKKKWNPPQILRHPKILRHLSCKFSPPAKSWRRAVGIKNWQTTTKKHNHNMNFINLHQVIPRLTTSSARTSRWSNRKNHFFVCTSRSVWWWRCLLVAGCVSVVLMWCMMPCGLSQREWSNVVGCEATRVEAMQSVAR